MQTSTVLQDGQLTVHVLRRALAGVAASVGGDLSQPQDISRRFGLDKTLAWRISRAVREEDAWQALEHLPSRAGISIFAGAMTKAGATNERLEQLWVALANFEKFVESSAGDRETLEMIVSVPSRRSAQKKLEAFRKGGFQCNASLLGVRAKAQVHTRLVSPSKTANMLDFAVVTGLIDLCRLRPRLPWPVATIRNWGGLKGDVLDDSADIYSIEPHPSDQTPTPIIERFCSPASLELRTVHEGDGLHRYILDGGDIGNAGSVNVYCGWFCVANASTFETAPGERGEHGIMLCTPAEELIYDILIHESLDYAMDLKVQVYSMFPGSPQYPQAGAEHTMLPVPTELVSLGRSLPDAPCEGVTDYDAMLELAASRLGPPLSEYRAFRYRLAYPPIPAMCIISHALLRQP